MTDPFAYTIKSFCEAHRISRPNFYAMLAQGTAPKVTMLGQRKIILAEDAAAFREKKAQRWLNPQAYAE
jgi:predicted DNA-binding transcriptional regulator AlpA